MKFLRFAFILLLSGCNHMKVEDFKGTSPEFILEQYFSGNTVASGVLFGMFGEVKRQFTVKLEGNWDGKNLILKEQFLFNDGEVQNRTWTVTKTDQNTYSGTASDVIGKATGKQFGSVMNWSYTLNIPVKGTNYKINFDDWMFLQADGTLLNKASMRKFGFKVGELFISFKKI